MPTKKTEADIITAEFLRMKARLAKKNLSNLEITGLTLKSKADTKKCDPGYSPRMVKMPDGSFKLRCVKDI